MPFLLLAVWLASGLALGYSLGQRALGKENRVAVLVAYGLIVGYVLQGLALILLWGWVPLGTGYYLVPAVFLVGSLALRIFPRTSPTPPHTTWGISVRETFAVLALLVIFAYLGHRVFTVGYQSTDAETLWFHSAVTERMTQGLFPISSPVEPDDPLRYRFAFHSLGAAIRANVAELSPEVLAALFSVTMPLMVVSLIGASIRLFGRAIPGIAASVLALFGGSLLPWYHLAELALTGSTILHDRSETVSGLVWHANTLEMIRVSPTIAAGFVVLTSVLWLLSEALDQGKASLSSRTVAALGLGYLGLMNEVYFAFLVTGTLAYSFIQVGVSLSSRAAPMLRSLIWTIAIVGLAGCIVLLRGGLSGGIGLVGGGAGSMQMVLNLDHFGEVVGPPRQDGSYWLPVASFATQMDSNFAILGVPLLFIVAFRARNRYVTRAALSASAALVAWTTVYSKQVPSDTYRLGQAAFTIYLAMLPFVIWKCRPASPAWAHLLRWGLPIVLAALIVPHVVDAILLTIAPPHQTNAIPGSVDYQASAYLRDSTSTHRILVPVDEGDVRPEVLYRLSGPGAAMRQLLALSGHAIPIGHFSYWNPQAYQPYYRQASLHFDRTSLEKLKIDWVYVLPYYLSAAQKAELDSAVNHGELNLERCFGQGGTETERWLFRVVRRE